MLQSRLQEIRPIVSEALGAGGVEAWLDTPHEDLGGRTPYQVMEEDEDGGNKVERIAVSLKQTSPYWGEILGAGT